MKKIVLFLLIFSLFIPSFVLAADRVDRKWIIENKYFGQGGLRLDEKISRAELATLVVRLMGLNVKNFKDSDLIFKDIKYYQGGWAAEDISIAASRGLIRGVSMDRFNPSGDVTYNELLTVFMRVLGYRDGIDFSSYPDDYYNKALEIGLADLYISGEKVVSREIVLSSMEKALNTSLKSSDDTLYEMLSSESKIVSRDTSKDDIEIKDLVFNTLVSGTFKGNLVGRDDFTGYRVVLLSNNGSIYDNVILDAKGDFTISDFDIGLIGKLGGYKYEIYDNRGQLILEDSLK